MLGRRGEGRAAVPPSGDEYLPSVKFSAAPVGSGVRRLDNPLGVAGGSRATAGAYKKLVRAATGRRIRDRLSLDETQRLLEQIVYGQRLTGRSM